MTGCSAVVRGRCQRAPARLLAWALLWLAGHAGCAADRPGQQDAGKQTAPGKLFRNGVNTLADFKAYNEFLKRYEAQALTPAEKGVGCPMARASEFFVEHVKPLLKAPSEEIFQLLRNASLQTIGKPSWDPLLAQLFDLRNHVFALDEGSEIVGVSAIIDVNESNVGGGASDEPLVDCFDAHGQDVCHPQGLRIAPPRHYRLMGFCTLKGQGVGSRLLPRMAGALDDWGASSEGLNKPLVWASTYEAENFYRRCVPRCETRDHVMKNYYPPYATENGRGREIKLRGYVVPQAWTSQLQCPRTLR